MAEQEQNNVNKTTLEEEIKVYTLEADIHDIKDEKSFPKIVFNLTLKDNARNKNKTLTGKAIFTNIVDKLFTFSGNIAFETDIIHKSPIFIFPEPFKIEFPVIFEGYCEHPESGGVYDDIETIKMLYKDKECHIYPTKHLKDNSKKRINIKFSTIINLPNMTTPD